MTSEFLSICFGNVYLTLLRSCGFQLIFLQKKSWGEAYLYLLYKENINPESMGSQPNRTQNTAQQPAVSLKSKSVSVQISSITFCDRRKGHVHQQEVFDITF